ncbi:MAG: hypothetical protein HKO76_04310 [Acidimicrobiia bacterium]|nr:hypothetical protein [Acidimicrobiia bacterium]
MKRRLALTLALSLIAGLSIAPAALAKDTNHTDYWATNGLECSKIDESQGQIWISDGDYDLVVVKASKYNDVIAGVSAGDTLRASSGKDISHIITCVGGDDVYWGV